MPSSLVARVLPFIALAMVTDASSSEMFFARARSAATAWISNALAVFLVNGRRAWRDERISPSLKASFFCWAATCSSTLTRSVRPLTFEAIAALRLLMPFSSSAAAFVAAMIPPAMAAAAVAAMAPTLSRAPPTALAPERRRLKPVETFFSVLLTLSLPVSVM